MADPARGPLLPDVTVILGDPRLSDPTKPDSMFTAEDLEAVDRMQAALGELDGYRFTYLDDHEKLLAQLVQAPPPFAMNFCDTGYRNDPTRELHVTALLELLGVPFSGSGPAALGTCYDKGAVRALAAAHRIPVPDEQYFDPEHPADVAELSFPALVKPCRGDGSVGITQDAIVSDPAQAQARLEWLYRECPGRGALVQEFLQGEEYSIGLVGNPGQGFTPLPALEVDYSGLDPELPRILSYESKTQPESPYWTQLRYRRARLDDGAVRRLVEHSTLLFGRLGCRDYARFDFRADSRGQIKLLEVNPNPAWCWDGKLNLMAEFAGRSYADLLRLILETAQARAASAPGA